MPVEYTVEQTEQNSSAPQYVTSNYRMGQRLTIANRRVTKLAFMLKKMGSPTGDIVFTIRKVTDDTIIASQVWGDAADLPTEIDWCEAEFDTPPTVDEEVRILCEPAGGDGTNYLLHYFNTSDVKGDENMCRLTNATYDDFSTYDDAYRYKYNIPGEAVPKSQGHIIG